MSWGAEAGKWQRALVTWSAELPSPAAVSCLCSSTFVAVPAGSDVRMVCFEYSQSILGHGGCFRGQEEVCWGDLQASSPKFPFQLYL